MTKPVAWMYERGDERKAYIERSQAALACSYIETPLYTRPASKEPDMSDMVERVALNLRLAGICHAHTHSVQIAQAAIAAMQADAAPVDNRVSTSNPVDDCGTPKTSGKLRPAIDVAADVIEANRLGAVLKGIAIIEQDREAVRAEQAAEIAKFKALAETLAGALEPFAEEWDEREFLAQRHWSFYREASKAIAEYKEARDAS